jgi:hypothetical protein
LRFKTLIFLIATTCFCDSMSDSFKRPTSFSALHWIAEVAYNMAKVPLTVLRGVVQDTWDNCPNSYIQDLFDSFPRRCQAVIEARGGLTRY